MSRDEHVKDSVSPAPKNPVVTTYNGTERDLLGTLNDYSVTVTLDNNGYEITRTLDNSGTYAYGSNFPKLSSLSWIEQNGSIFLEAPTASQTVWIIPFATDKSPERYTGPEKVWYCECVEGETGTGTHKCQSSLNSDGTPNCDPVVGSTCTRCHGELFGFMSAIILEADFVKVDGVIYN